MMRKFKFFEGIVEDYFVFDNLTVDAGIRTLRATWQRQDMQELNAYHAIDAEAELTRILSQEWAQAIDNEIMRTITNTEITDVPDEPDDLDISRFTRNWNGGNRA